MIPISELYITKCYDDAPYVIYEVRNAFGEILLTTYDVDEAEEFINAA